MKYGILNGQKKEAFKGGKGKCPSCNSKLIAKCGEIKINHWAHLGNRNCDHWWENETTWHREWKNNFPVAWQEVVHFDKISGEKHIADVRTSENWVLEFQHSYITPEERKSRNQLYPKLVWVVDGLRRKTDVIQFKKILASSTRAPVGNVNIREVNFPEDSRLLVEWMSDKTPVFFDFQNSNLWFLLPLGFKGKTYLIQFSRNEFIKTLNNEGFDELKSKILPSIYNIINKHNKSKSNLIANMAFNNLLEKNRTRRNFNRRRF